MKIYNFSPGGNDTVLVDNQDSLIPRKDYHTISQKYLVDSFEQVGFIVPGKHENLRLEMMGGEFCVNALRSLGAWIYSNTGKRQITVESSGTENLVEMSIERWVKIKLLKKFNLLNLDTDLKLVLLDGICHFVWETNNFGKKLFLEKLKEIKKIYKTEIKDYKAVGLIGLNKKNEIFPLIEVFETNSIIFETACGSGTIAAFIADDFSQSTFTQPSGTIFILSQDTENFYLNGPVTELPN